MPSEIQLWRVKGSCTRIYQFVPIEFFTFPFFEANFVTWNGVWEPLGASGAGLVQKCVSGAFWEPRPDSPWSLLDPVYYYLQEDQGFIRRKLQMCNKSKLGRLTGAPSGHAIARRAAHEARTVNSGPPK